MKWGIKNNVIEICEDLKEDLENIIFYPYRQIVFHASELKNYMLNNIIKEN